MVVSRRYLILGLVALVLGAGVVAFVHHRRAVKAANAPGGPAARAALNAVAGAVRDRGDAPAEESGLILDEDHGGLLRLEGIVLDAAGVPAPGVAVTVSSNPPRDVTSGEDGSFVVDTLAARRYEVSARAASGVAGPVTVRLTATSDPVTLRLAPAASVEVHVVEASGPAPVKNASVELRGVATLAGTTDASGVLVLTSVAPGPSSLVAWAPGFARSYVTVNVPVQSGGTPIVARQQIVLHVGAAASGTVRTQDGQPVANAVVSFEATSAWMQRSDPRRDAVTTDANGAYRFEALPAGSFRFVGRDDRHAPGAAEAVRLDGVTERSGIDIVMPPGVTVVGKVVARSGAPVAAAAVRVAARAEGLVREPLRQSYTDDAGHFEMSGLPQKHLQLVALHESASSETIEIEPTTERVELLVTLELDGTIAGVVVDSHGEPVENADVFAMTDFGGGGGGRRGGGGGPVGGGGLRFDRALRGGAQEPTDASGHFALHGLRPGEYQLRASRPGQRAPSFGREGTPAKVGDKAVKIVLPAGGGVHGKVLFADGHAPELFTVAAGPGDVTPFASADGVFELGGLPPGEQSLQIAGPQFDRTSVRVTIRADQIVDAGTISVTRGRSIYGHVLADGKPVGGATVYAGRRLGGDGTTPSTSGWGPAGAGATKSTTTDTDGSFVLDGVGNRTFALLADHETLGRSTTVQVAAGTDPVSLDLTLAPFGALAGYVKKDGVAVEGAMVNASSQNVPGTSFTVPSGADGSYRFDRLAPDTYLVSAMPAPQRGRPPGFVFNNVVATVKSGETADAELTLVSGKGMLVVKPVLAGGGDAGVFAVVQTAAFPLSARTVSGLQLEVAAHGAGANALLFTAPGLPARQENLAPGAYSVCVAPFPAEVRDRRAIADYMGREGDNLPAFCVAAQVGESEKTVNVPVTLPPFVPPPGAH